jgi:hypothetical protein
MYFIFIIIILPQFCNVATLVSQPQEELAKFGYRPERKVENFKNICYILTISCGNLSP